MEVINENCETQHSVDTSQRLSKQYSESRSLRSSSYFRGEIVRLNAGRTPGPKTMEAPSRKMRQSDSDSTRAPLTRGFETQFKLKQTPKNAKKTKKNPPQQLATFAKSDSSDSDEEEIAGPSATIAMEKYHVRERSRKSNKSRSSKESRKTTPDMPVEFQSSSTELIMAPPRKKAKALTSSTSTMQKVSPNVSEAVSKEQQMMMQQFKEVRK